MAPTLPPDIILLICEELGNQHAFGTLFNAALSSNQIAPSALLWLYRIHNTSSIRTGENPEDDMPRSGTTHIEISKWAQQWRSIILSSYGETAYPYCLYIRTLDLTNLKDLFEDPIFKRQFEDTFFAGSMSTLKSPGATTRRLKPNINAVAVGDMVGEVISKYASDSAKRSGGTAALEELSGEIQKDSLPRWIRRLPRLKFLKLWKGHVLNETVAQAIKDQCPDFDSLVLYYGLGEDMDAKLSSFFTGLKPNALRSLEIVSYHNAGPQTFLSLNSHCTSLKYLHIGNLQEQALNSLPLLNGCIALETLSLQDLAGTVDLEATANDVFLGFISWLTSCKTLKSISLSNFRNGPKILTSVCLEESITLDSLHLDKYTLTGNQDFHRALAHQTSLTSLHLKGDAEDPFPDDLDTLVNCLSQLKNLKYLNILDISDNFRTSEIQLLALNLQKLEELVVSGYEVTDEVWRGIRTLPNLRSLTFHALTSFTYDGIMDYISTLQSTNSGLQLFIMAADVLSNLSTQQIASIRHELITRVDGKFDFVLYREVESDFPSDSD